jgi:hypothetical protein
MGLDVYVGPLTRYYRGEWDTIIQQMGAAGTEVAVVRPDQPPGGEREDAPGPAARPSEPPRPEPIWLDRIERWLNMLSRWAGGRSRAPAADPLPLADAVAAWRAKLNEQLAGQLAQPLDWDESEAAPYFTDKPAWVGYSCLLLLAAHDEHPQLSRPTQAIDNWSDDPAWQVASRDDFAASRYGHILSPSIWLPCEFARAFSADDMAGEDEVVIGSSVALLVQLRELNERTYQGSPEDLAAWLEGGPDPVAWADQTAGSGAGGRQRAEVAADVSPFDHAARFALALFLDLAAKSVAHRLPMTLDW